MENGRENSELTHNELASPQLVVARKEVISMKCQLSARSRNEGMREIKIKREIAVKSVLEVKGATEVKRVIVVKKAIEVKYVVPREH